MGEAQVDGDAPLLLFLQPVGVGAGERAHEGALAVVDVAGGADDERPQGLVSRCGWRHAEDRLRGLVQLGGEGEAGFLLGAHDEGVVLPGDLDEEEELVAGEVQDDAVPLLVEEAFEQLVAELSRAFCSSSVMKWYSWRVTFCRKTSSLLLRFKATLAGFGHSSREVRGDSAHGRSVLRPSGS